MTILGDASVWKDSFRDELIPEILTMVSEVWTALTKPRPSEQERRITKKLCAAIMQSQQLKRLPLRLDYDSVLLDPDGNTIGVLDLRLVSDGYSPESYFSFECKRLYACSRSTARVKALTDEYVDKGMQRYVDGQYAPRMKHGGMIGYVLSGTVPRAIGAVQRQIQSKYGRLKMASPARLRQSLMRPADPTAKETEHQRAVGLFRLHHLFLGC